MHRRKLFKNAAAMLPAVLLHKAFTSELLLNSVNSGETMADGIFKPTWHSLQQYQTPAWFRNAKFGIWAHWGAQCQPEYGDWYARGMYQEGSDQYNYHVHKYGHPSKFGFKDVIHEWKADQFDPEYLVGLYKNAGAKYFVALANHHDNFDNYNSKHHRWNSVNFGPKKDLIGGWAKAAKKHALHFGVSVHAAHAWSWYETAQRSDKQGAMKGIAYDGKLTKQDGKGTWWQGYDPQDLYAQNHALSENSYDDGMIHRQWNWGNGVAQPSKKYIDHFYNRTIDLINTYEPDLLYFDDTALPFYPVSDAGLRIAAHMYNRSIKKYGNLQAVINGKILDEQQRKCMVWDIERGASNSIEPFTWQTDTCIGSWHYDRRVYDNKWYKSAKMVIEILTDVVSKNGNLLLNIPVRGNGTIDEQELAVVEQVGKWMKVNSEAIYDTRPWKIFGEGPALSSVAPLSAQGFNEGKTKPLTMEDFRFTQKGNNVYAIFYGWQPAGKIIIRSMAEGAGIKVSKVQLLGYDAELEFLQTGEGTSVTLPANAPCENAFVLKLAIV